MKSSRAVVSVSIVILNVGVTKKHFSNSAPAVFLSIICKCIIGSLKRSGVDLLDG